MNKLINDFKINLIRKVHTFRHRHLDDFVFVRINKTGGSSIKWALQLPIGHTTALEYIDVLGRKEWERRFSFTVVRNPWDRVVSQYHFRLKTNQTRLGNQQIDFKTWVELAYGKQASPYYDDPKMFMPQVDWIADQDGDILVDFILRFENLHTDFSTLCDTLGKDLELPHIKSSQRGDYQDYYDQKTKNYVEDWFSKDITTFQYSYEKGA